MTAWALLMGICLVLPLGCGWVAGRPAGAMGVLLGLVIGLAVGAIGVLAMRNGHRYFERWLEARKAGLRSEVALQGGLNLAGIAWCASLGLIAHLITSVLIH